MGDARKTERGANDARTIGGRIAPPRFLAFLIVLAIAVPAGIALWGTRLGGMAGFDLAALVFLVAVIPLLDDETGEMRAAARRNDANRAVLLGITGLVCTVILVAVGAELAQKDGPDAAHVMLIVLTLALAWTFSNVVFALHYAHLYYAERDGTDHGGLDFPGDKAPDYWDFIYFSVTLGMTFQTSDVEISARGIRRVVIFHTLAAFVFNLGIVAFTINVLGGG